MSPWPVVRITTAQGPRQAVAPLVVSASRATDIPAFHVRWLLERLRAGYCLWRNPFNAEQKQYVTFARCKCLIFWSKNPLPLLQRLAEMLAPSGIGAISLWDFAQDPRMKAKAEASTARAKEALGLPDLEEGDYILGWQDDEDAFRYCHSFSEGEMNAIAGSLPAHTRLIERFQADGRTGTLNTYLVFERER